MKKDTNERTLIASMLVSAPGPLILGVGLIFGQSPTQIADFIRRTVEFVAVIISWAIFRRVRKTDVSEKETKKMERWADRSVGVALMISGLGMGMLSVFFQVTNQGVVILPLVIAFLGWLVNLFFWFRYRKLSWENSSSILIAQKNLYRSKTIVDTAVTLALLAVAVAPGSVWSLYLDRGGSVVVALYLLYTGIKMLRESYV